MKQLPFLLVSLMLLARCKQSEPIPAPIIGDWVWTGTSGGFGGALTKPKVTEEFILKIRSDNQFSVTRNDTLLSTGSFRLNKARSIYSGKEELFIETSGVITNNGVANNKPFAVYGIIWIRSNNQLSIADNHYDGYGSSFLRK